MEKILFPRMLRVTGENTLYYIAVSLEQRKILQVIVTSLKRAFTPGGANNTDTIHVVTHRTRSILRSTTPSSHY